MIDNMDTARLEQFKQKLLTEQQQLEQELGQIAKRNPQNPEDWEPTAPDMNVQQSDPSERADVVEEFENISGSEAELEFRLNEVIAALERIANGTYGVCAKEGERIPIERLEANPAAATCIEHN